jgi:hypothetical protein
MCSMKRQLSGLQYRFAVFSLFASSLKQLLCARHEMSSQLDGPGAWNCVHNLHPKNISPLFCATSERNQNVVCETAVYKEKRKDVISQSKHDFSYLVRLNTSMITLKKEP